MAPGHETHDITQILSAARLDELRTRFDNRALIDLARANMARRYPPAGAFLDPLSDHFYDAPPVTKPVDRERIVVALLAARMSNLELAVHFYWSLMVGLSVQDVAETLLLVLAYSGTQTYNNAIALLERILLVLDAQPADGLDTMSCVKAIMQAV